VVFAPNVLIFVNLQALSFRMTKSADIAFLITESTYFLTHRRPLAEGCRSQGWRPLLITNLHEEDRAALAGIDVVPFDMVRVSHHPLRELATLVRLFLLLRRLRPRLLHAVGLKPVLYGALAGRLLGLNVVCALAGLGYVFTSGRLRVRLFRRLIVLWLRLLFQGGRTRLILQNDDDADKLVANGVIPAERVVMIRGSGIDLDAFRPTPEPDGLPVFTVVSRMLADKGIRELVMAARLLRWRGVPCRVRLVGGPDPHNLSSLSLDQLAAWRAEGVVEWNGPEQDIPRVWAESHVCVLPSYREGMPKALLEAAACGRPIITTDVPGCRAVVEDGVEGLLVPVCDWTALAEAMERLARSPALRAEMGRAARARAEAEFGQLPVVERTIALYHECLSPP